MLQLNIGLSGFSWEGNSWSSIGASTSAGATTGSRCWWGAMSSCNWPAPPSQISLPYVLGDSLKLSGEVASGAIQPSSGYNDSSWANASVVGMSFVDTNGRPVSGFGYATGSGTAYSFEGATQLPARATSVSSNFNDTPIPGGSVIWFDGAAKVSPMNAHVTTPVHVYLTNSQIQFSAGGTPYSVAIPAGLLVFSPTATSATTTFDPVMNMWSTTVPTSGLSGYDFLTGFGFVVPDGGLPGGITNVTWSGAFFADAPDIAVNWQWGGAVYSQFATPSQYNSLGVKPVHDKNASIYQNPDQAGTPENFKAYVVGGATGEGSHNWTGTFSEASSLKF